MCICTERNLIKVDVLIFSTFSGYLLRCWCQKNLTVERPFLKFLNILKNLPRCWKRLQEITVKNTIYNMIPFSLKQKQQRWESAWYVNEDKAFRGVRQTERGEWECLLSTALWYFLWFGLVYNEYMLLFSLPHLFRPSALEWVTHKLFQTEDTFLPVCWFVFVCWLVLFFFFFFQ